MSLSRPARPLRSSNAPSTAVMASCIGFRKKYPIAASTRMIASSGNNRPQIAQAAMVPTAIPAIRGAVQRSHAALEAIRRPRPGVQRLGMQHRCSPIRRRSPWIRGTARRPRRSAIAGVAGAVFSQVRRRKQPLRQDALAQLGPSRAQQLVQTVRAEQIQDRPHRYDAGRRSARRSCLCRSIDRRADQDLPDRNPPRAAPGCVDYGRAGDKPDRATNAKARDAQPQCGSAARPKAQPCHDQKCNADGQTQALDARIEGVEARDARACDRRDALNIVLSATQKQCGTFPAASFRPARRRKPYWRVFFFLRAALPASPVSPAAASSGAAPPIS